MYLPVISALSFLLWYRPAYNAYMKEASVFFCTSSFSWSPPITDFPSTLDMYFLFAGFHLAFSACELCWLCSPRSTLTLLAFQT
jgi:hypothetical protein